MTASVYQNYERPFPLTQGNPYVESRHPMLRALNLQNSPVGDAFFAEQNVEVIQKLLRQAIYKLTGYLIDRQSPEQLGFIMQNVFFTEHNSQPMSLPDEVRRLNLIVVSEAVPPVSSSLVAYLAYLRDASRLKTPIPRAINTSIKGSRQLAPNSWIT